VLYTARMLSSAKELLFQSQVLFASTVDVRLCSLPSLHQNVASQIQVASYNTDELHTFVITACRGGRCSIQLFL
jgi:hypothetical protein